MNIIHTVFTLMIVLCPLTAYCSIGSVVSIYSELQDGSVRLGTGFFLYDGKTVATAYHVVKDAISIKIRSKKNNIFTNDVLVKGYSDSKDIALLEVGVASLTNPFKLTLEPPKASENLVAIGNPRGIPNQIIKASATQDTFINSFQIKDKGKDIFALSIDLVPLDITVYESMSGSPVVDGNDNVVGLLSGSYNEGGGLAWAIPSKYIDVIYSECNNKKGAPVSSIKWAPLVLYSSVWKNYARSYRQSPEVSSLFNNYNSNVSKLERVTKELIVKSYNVSIGVPSLVSDVNTAIQVAQLDLGIPQTPKQPTITTVNKLLLTRSSYFLHKQSLMLYFNSVSMRNSVSNDIRNATLKIIEQIENSNLTEQDRKSFGISIKNINGKYPELSQGSLESILGISSDNIASLNKFFNENSNLHFGSLEEANAFIGNCSAVKQQLEAFIIQPGSAQLPDQEVYLYKDYYKIFKKYSDYIEFSR